MKRNALAIAGGIAAGTSLLLILLGGRRRSRPRGGRVAFVGDSIVARGIAVSDLNEVPGMTVTNLGVSGDTTGRMLARLPSYSFGYNEVIVMGMINDIMRRRWTAQQTIDNLRRIYRAVKASGARLVIVTSTPWGGYRAWTQAKQGIQDEVNQWLMFRRADGMADVVIDAYRPLVDPRRIGYLNPRYDAGDGLHLSVVGQHELARLIIGQAY